MNTRILPALLGLLVAAGCASPPAGPAVDADLARVQALAYKTFAQGELAAAADLYATARARAMAMDDAAGIAQTAYNEAACRLALGEPQAARDRLQQARAAYARMAQTIPPELGLLDSRVARQLGQPAAAMDLSTQALAGLGDRDAPATRAQLHVLRAELAMDQNDPAAAAAEVAHAQAALGKNPVPAVAAQITAANARLDSLNNQPATAAANFAEAARLFQEAGQYAEMSSMLALAGTAAGEADQFQEAAMFFLRAAGSDYGQGRLTAALENIDQALKSADQAKAADLKGQAAALFEEIKKQVDAQAVTP